jgi:hypothetical protein
MQFTLRGMRRGQSGSTADDRVDAAAAIARYFNAAEPVAEASEESAIEVVAEPDAARLPVAESPAGPVVDGGATVRVPLSTTSTDDPLVAALLALGNSAMYDLTGAVGAGHWDEIVVELPVGKVPLFRARVGGAWGAWHPSPHSDRTLELFRILLQEADPGVGYDVVARPREMVVCRWPHRASDARDADLADAVEEPRGDVGTRKEKPKRRGWRR